MSNPLDKMAENARELGLDYEPEQRTTTENNGGKTGWPPGLLQDDCKGLSKWLANKPDAKRRVREALDKKRPQNCGTGYCSCIECVMEPAQEPAPRRDAMVANLVREGINKHKARELADHFVGLTTAPAWVSLTDEEIDDIYQGVGRNDLMLVREVEAKLRKKNHA